MKLVRLKEDSSEHRRVVACKVAKKEKKSLVNVWRGFKLACGFLNLRVIEAIPSGVVQAQTNQIWL